MNHLLKYRLAKQLVGVLTLSLITSVSSAFIATGDDFPPPFPAPTIASFAPTSNSLALIIEEGSSLNNGDNSEGYYVNYSLDGGDTWVTDQMQSDIRDDNQASEVGSFTDIYYDPLSIFNPDSTYGSISLVGIPLGTHQVQFRFETTRSIFSDSTSAITFNSTTSDGPFEDLQATNFQVTSGNESVGVSFTTPAPIVSNPSLNLFYIYTLDGGDTWSDTFAPPVLIPVSRESSDSFVIDNLTNGVSYDIGISLFVSNFGPIITPQGPSSPPLAISGEYLSATPDSSGSAPEITSIDSGNGFLKVSFDTPLGTTPSTYDVSTNNGLTWTTLDPAVRWSPLTIFGLTNGTSYSVKIRARYGSQVGPESNSMSATANSQTQIYDFEDETQNGFLQGTYATIGIRDNGAFGSSIIPEGLNSIVPFEGGEGPGDLNCVGFIVDRQRNGFAPTVGDQPPYDNIDDGDFFCPGSPYEGWGIEFDGTLARNIDPDDEYPGNGTAIVRTVPMSVVSTESTQAIEWRGIDPNSGLAVRQISSLENNGQQLKVTVNLTNETANPLENVYYQRSVDPDNDNSRGENPFFTTNTLVRNGVDGLGAQVKARFPSEAEIFLSSNDPQVHGAICPGWRTSSSAIYDGTDDGLGFGEGSGCTREDVDGDYAISLAWLYPTIAAGETVTLNFTYSLTSESAALPSVTAIAATNVGATTTATLNGSVNANGSSTAVSFEYGTTDDLSGTTTTVAAAQSPIEGLSDLSVSRSLTGLVRGTAYYYRVVATNSTGTATSNIVSFTPIGDVKIRVNDVSNRTETSVRLNGAIDPAGGEAIGIQFLVSVDPVMLTGVTNYAMSDLMQTNGFEDVFVNLSSLSAGTTYYYKLIATNESGSASSSIYSFTTPPAPSAVNTGADVNETNATLYGDVNPYGVANTSVVFRYSLDPTFATFEIANTLTSPPSNSVANEVSVDISGLVLGETYYYLLIATNSNGSNTSAIANFQPGIAPTVSLATPIMSGLILSLEATVNPGGFSTSTAFQLATSAEEFSTCGLSCFTFSGDPSEISGNSNVSVTGTLSSALNPSTAYWVRAVASNLAGIVAGQVSTFTTPAISNSNPTVEITAASSTYTFANPFNFVVTFSSSVTGFALNDITVGGTSDDWILSNMSSGVINNDGSQSYTVTATPSSTSTTGQLSFLVSAARVIDSFTNPNNASEPLLLNIGSAITLTASRSRLSSIADPYEISVLQTNAPSNYLFAAFIDDVGCTDFNGSYTPYFRIGTGTVDASDLFREGLSSQFTCQSPTTWVIRIYAPDIDPELITYEYDGYLASVTVRIAAAEAPTITGPSRIVGTVGTAITPVNLTLGSDTGSETATVTSGYALPAGLTLTSAGRISGTPTTAGTTTTSFTVTDSLNETATATVEFVIAPFSAPVVVAPSPVPFLSALTSAKLNLKDGRLMCTPGTYNSGYTLSGVIQSGSTALLSPTNFIYNLFINGVAQTKLVATLTSNSASWTLADATPGSIYTCSVIVSGNDLSITDKSTDNKSGVNEALATQKQTISEADVTYKATLKANTKAYPKALKDNRANWNKEMTAIRANYYLTIDRIKAKGGAKMVTDSATAYKVLIAAKEKANADYAASKPAAVAAKKASDLSALDAKAAAIAKANATYGTFIESIGYGVLIP